MIDAEAQFKIETKRYLNIADIDGLRVSCGETVIEGPLNLFLNNNDPVLTTFLPKCGFEKPKSNPQDQGQGMTTPNMVLEVSKLVQILRHLQAQAPNCCIAFAVKKASCAGQDVKK